MPDPAFKPEFPWSVDALLAQGMLEALQADPHLSTYMTEISAWEVEDLLLRGSFTAPLLALILAGQAEQAKGSSYQADVETALELVFVIPKTESRRGAQDFFLARLISYAKGVLYRAAEDLQDDDGLFLKCGLTRFQRVPVPRLLPSDHLARTCTVLFTSTINQRTRQWT